MRAARAALAVAAIVAAGAILLSGGSHADPRTPPALPGLPPPFLGTAVTGDGGMTAAVDAYGDVVNLYAPGPAGAATIVNPSARQAAGTVASDTGIVPRVQVGDGPALPLWRAESVRQSYLPGTNAVRTMARFEGGIVATVTAEARGEELAVLVGVAQTRRGGAGRGLARQRDDGAVRASLEVNVAAGVECREGRRADAVALICGRDHPGIGGVNAGEISFGASGGDDGIYEAAGKVVLRGAVADRRWLARAQALGAGAPAWARALYRRSLLTLRALTGRNGAAPAGAREGWAYVWPRDAATNALALEAAGYSEEGQGVARFLAKLDLGAAARFDESGDPVPGRGPQGDEAGWVTAAARATGINPVSIESRGGDGSESAGTESWRNLPDYQEGAPGDYLDNAIAAADTTSVDGPKTLPMGTASARQQLGGGGTSIGREFGTARGLVRRAGDPASGLDSAAAWAVRPFRLRALYPQARKTLLRLTSQGTRFGITPGEGWTGGEDPWTAPTASTAWALAGLARDEGSGNATVDRRAALGLLEDLRRAATPAGALPERVSVDTGLPRSTTPLLWSSALTVLTLHELWPTHPD